MPESAAAVAQRVARRVVRVLIGIRDGRHSGDDSGLVSVWEEVCVQVQDQHSVFWWAYEETICDLATREVERLPRSVLSALWLETTPGEDWLCDQDDDAASVPYCVEDVVEHVTGILYTMAANWSNRRIRAYLDRR